MLSHLCVFVDVVGGGVYLWHSTLSICKRQTENEHLMAYSKGHIHIHTHVHTRGQAERDRERKEEPLRMQQHDVMHCEAPSSRGDETRKREKEGQASQVTLLYFNQSSCQAF